MFSFDFKPVTKNMKNYLLIPVIAVFVSFTAPAFSQTVSYTYDNAGNMTGRHTITYPQSLSAKAGQGESESVKAETDLTFEKQPVKIYPNPTSGFLEVEIPEEPDNNEKIQLLVYDMGGRKILDLRQESPKTIIDLSRYPNGMYILNMKKGNLVSQWKIIKK
jgi:hypothetical protein